ncbi:hypothetical protein V1519DRAFT_456325 [Lipomyces tetrasporus]
MATYSLPAQCDVRSKLIASCALFLLCDLVRGCLYQVHITVRQSCVSWYAAFVLQFMPPPFTCLLFCALMPLLLLVLEP